MTSLSAVSEVPSSEPESLDSLDYDDWEGQFEFVGNSNPAATTLTRYADEEPHPSCEQDDLNLGRSYALSSNRPILIDEETFLSVQSNEFVDSGAPSGYFIENALKDLSFDGLPYKHQIDANHKFCVKDLANNRSLNSFNFEDLNNIKNKLISAVDFDAKELLNANNNNNNINNNNHHKSNSNGNSKMNGFSAELCDNLSEQVSKSVNLILESVL